MDRLAQLIGKLNEQFAQKAGPAQLMLTVRQIEAELNQLNTATGKALGTAKVAVMMPSGPRAAAPEAAVVAVPEPAIEPPPPPKSNGKAVDKGGWLFDPMTEIPTLAHQENRKELNDTIVSQESSLNDTLKTQVVEVGHVLTEAPIRDLKKAIGINDRFVFISELFRGDENMYERSIKTINGFRIFAEAEYWIERELKVKLGWDTEKPSARHFYQLVKRRFS